jgi:phospholipid/cholesterol/gamma-HCH transport system ATP-binding protein
MIEIKNLYKSFNSKPVLQGLNLTIKDGETFTIIGGSGCGKSVLLKHIVGLLHPDSGDLLIDGKSVVTMNKDELLDIQRKFGFVFQGAALFDSLTVKDNVGFGLRNLEKYSKQEIDKIVSERLKMVGLEGIEKLKPAELSGGMKKRVGFARAIAYDPPYLLYDEPTTGLDPIMADVINELIMSLKQKLKNTSIVVTHDMHSAYKISDRIGMLYEGKIIECGTPTEIMHSKNPLVQKFISGVSVGATLK